MQSTSSSFTLSSIHGFSSDHHDFWMPIHFLTTTTHHLSILHRAVTECICPLHSWRARQVPVNDAVLTSDRVSESSSKPSSSPRSTLPEKWYTNKLSVFINYSQLEMLNSWSQMWNLFLKMFIQGIFHSYDRQQMKGRREWIKCTPSPSLTQQWKGNRVK